MAGEAEEDDSEFRLPSGFLTDLEMLTDFDPDPSEGLLRWSGEFSDGFGDSSGFRSDLSSPVESVICTNETESDDDDSAAELSRRVANSSFLFDAAAAEKVQNRKLSSSPQSTLCGYKPVPRGKQSSVSSCGYMQDSVSAAKMRIAEETAASYFVENSSAAAAAAGKFMPISTERRCSGTGFFLGQTQRQIQISYQQQLEEAKIRRMKKQQMLMNWIHDQGKEQQIPDTIKNIRSQSSSMASRPNLQSQKLPNSGMRAVFLGETGLNKERVGTGVFMPRRFDKRPAESHKKSVYSTVLLPERVVQALNLHIDSPDSLLHLRNKEFHKSEDADPSTKAKHNPTMNHHEHQLPGEWTY